MKEVHCLFSLLVVFSVPTSVLPGSHSLSVVTTYITGDTPFPEFSFVIMLDDLAVGYFDSEKGIYVSRGLDKEEKEDDVLDPNLVLKIASYMQADLELRYQHFRYEFNHTDNIHVQQRLALCELLENDQPGPMYIKNAIRGSVADELYYYDGKYTYKNGLNFTKERMKPHIDIHKWHVQNLYYPACTKTLRNYLTKRSNQVKKKVKPRVRFIKRRRSVSGWDGVTCLVTGFYPRHINLTIFQDGQPVPDHLITGGELLPNDDGTYQMRKNLEIGEEEAQKHNFNCTVTHLSIDNKLDIQLELDPGEPILITFSYVLVVVVILLSVIGLVIGLMFRRCKKKQTVKCFDLSALTTFSQRGSSSTSSEEQSEISSLNADSSQQPS